MPSSRASADPVVALCVTEYAAVAPFTAAGVLRHGAAIVWVTVDVPLFVTGSVHPGPEPGLIWMVGAFTRLSSAPLSPSR